MTKKEPEVLLREAKNILNRVVDQIDKDEYELMNNPDILRACGELPEEKDDSGNWIVYALIVFCLIVMLICVAAAS